MRGRRLTWTTVRTAGLVLKVGDLTGIWHLSSPGCKMSDQFETEMRFEIQIEIHFKVSRGHTSGGRLTQVSRKRPP